MDTDHEQQEQHKPCGLTECSKAMGINLGKLFSLIPIITSMDTMIVITPEYLEWRKKMMDSIYTKKE